MINSGFVNANRPTTATTASVARFAKFVGNFCEDGRSTNDDRETDKRKEAGKGAAERGQNYRDGGNCVQLSMYVSHIPD